MLRNARVANKEAPNFDQIRTALHFVRQDVHESLIRVSFSDWIIIQRHNILYKSGNNIRKDVLILYKQGMGFIVTKTTMSISIKDNVNQSMGHANGSTKKLLDSYRKTVMEYAAA